MKPKLFFCLLFLMGIGCYANGRDVKRDTSVTIAQAKRAQIKGYYYSRESIKGYKKAFDNCTFTNQYTVAQRLKMYPFNVAAKILAVSYWGGGEPNYDVVIGKPARVRTYRERHFYEGLIIKKKRLDHSTLFDLKTLTQAQINNLSNILFNYDYAGMRNYTFIGHAGCFFPRNSIIFLDKNDKVIDHLDICFRCQNAESPTYKINVGVECMQKYTMLANFFVAVGVPYGIGDETKWKSPLDSILSKTVH